MRFALMISSFAAFLALPVAAQRSCSRDAACPQDPPCKPGVCTEVVQEAEICEAFSGGLSFKSAEGLVQGRVVVRDWQIANEQREEIPHQGFLVVHLRAGALVTDIEGERQAWAEDSFWSVPAGQQLIVYTARDSVVLQTVEFMTGSEPRRKPESQPAH